MCEGDATARRNRFAVADHFFHVVNRGNDRRDIFLDEEAYRTFLRIVDTGCQRHAVQIVGLCVMPNHFHLLLRPKTDAALSAYMQWVSCRYACNFRSQTGTMGNGHVFQRRFWSAPVVGEHHFLAVLRYIEANPVRANLVSRAEAWPWSSLSERCEAKLGFLTAPPLQLPRDWRDLVNQGQSPDVVTAIRDAVSPKPGRPDRKSVRP